MKKYISVIYIAFTIIILAACNSSDKINYGNNQYTFIENPSLEVGNIKKFGEKIGSYEGSDVYKINGESEKNWIYLNDQSMSDSPVGLYKSFNIKMDSLNDFNPDNIKILEASFNNEKTIYSTKEQKIIDDILSSINRGKVVSESSIENDENNKESIILEFRSGKFPNLVYIYDYIKSKDGKYYISYENSKIQIDSTINKICK